MQNISKRQKENILDILKNTMIPIDLIPSSSMEIRIIIKNNNINLRELSLYLSTIDKVYGRIQPEGFLKYSKRPHQQLRISKFRHGTIELIIERILADKDVRYLLLLVLFLKYLPQIIKSSAETLRLLIGSYRDYQDAKLIRLNIKILKKQLEKDNAISSIAENQISKVAQILALLYAAEGQKLQHLIRFAKNNIKQITIKFKK